jgi:hypothetical protein
MQEIEAKPTQILVISGSLRNKTTNYLVQGALRIVNEK